MTFLESLGQKYLNDMNFVHPEPHQENQESQDHHPSIMGVFVSYVFFLILNIIILKQILFLWSQLATHVTMSAILPRYISISKISERPGDPR